ncbi:DUF7937 domain-containing protein [Brachybacterium sp. DNPG3]
MNRDRRDDGPQDADWIFATDDPRSLPTERLPSRAEFDRYAAPLLAHRTSPALPQGDNETVDLSDIDPEALAAGAPDAARGDGADAARGAGAGNGASAGRSPARPVRSRDAISPYSVVVPSPLGAPAAEPDADTGAIPIVGDGAADGADGGADGAGGAGGADSADGAAASAAGAPSAPSPSTYARSGTTPNEPDRVEGTIGGIVLPDRFRELGVFDALRDVLALICLVSALTTTFTLGDLPLLSSLTKTSIGISLGALVVVHLLRWIPKKPPLGAVRAIRIVGLLPALAAALIVMGADLVASLPVLFASLPEGPPVGIGIGVPLLLLGAIVGMEPRAHEGYLPTKVARGRARAALAGVGIAAAAALLLALVMIVGRVFTTGWGYSMMTLANTLISMVLLTLVIASSLRRDRYWFVFSAGAVAGLVIAGLADNTLRLQFAAPMSFATGFVYLPFLFAAFGLMISRSFVRTMPISFARPDWLVYTVRAFEFSAVMHAAAVLWHLLAAVAGTTGISPGGPVLHLLDALVCAVFGIVSLSARTALLNRPADRARASGVVSALVLIVVGFLAIIVNSLATGYGAGLVTGGAALAIGIAAALMLTVPAPVRDEFGAPDLAQMFADFRSRDGGRASLLERVPDVTAERSRKKTFPGR